MSDEIVECDPSFEVCEDAEIVAEEEEASGSLLDTIGSFTLPLSGALQLGTTALYFIDKPSKDADDYMMYQAILNGVFGTAGLVFGALALVPASAEEEEEEVVCEEGEECPEEEEEEEAEERLRQDEEAEEGEEEEVVAEEEEASEPLDITNLVALSGLVSGGAGLALSFMAGLDNYDTTPQILNLAASSLAVLTGTLALVGSLGGAPAEEEEVDEEGEEGDEEEEIEELIL
jgi:hypothetical protein